jgi:hypothetical protein
MQVIIDERVNKEIEKYFKDLGYIVNKVKKHAEVYNEISSHTDIFAVKIGDTVVSSGNVFKLNLDEKYNWIFGDNVDKTYPETAKYNVCIIDNYAIHNFKITDKIVLEVLNLQKYNLINVKQGYSRCSIIPLKGKSAVTSDKGIYNILIKNGFDVLYLDPSELDIKLYSKDFEYSSMSGFIGGCSCVLNDTVIFFGDITRFKCKDKLIDFIKAKGYNIKDFKNMDVIDYGSCIFLD